MKQTKLKTEPEIEEYATHLYIFSIFLMQIYVYIHK